MLSTKQNEINPADPACCGSRMNTEDRLKRLFATSPEQMKAIDGILESGIHEKPIATSGPLLMGMFASAKLLGVSHATLWRMIKFGLLKKVEVLPGSFRLRRADLEAIAAGQKQWAAMKTVQVRVIDTHRDSAASFVWYDVWCIISRISESSSCFKEIQPNGRNCIKLN